MNSLDDVGERKISEVTTPLTECVVCHSVGPDPSHIWYTWIPLIPDVGRHHVAVCAPLSHIY